MLTQFVKISLLSIRCYVFDASIVTYYSDRLSPVTFKIDTFKKTKKERTHVLLLYEGCLTTAILHFFHKNVS